LRDLRGGRRDFFCVACHAAVTVLDDGQQLIAHWEPLPAPETPSRKA
jgi:hypothetical protein